MGLLVDGIWKDQWYDTGASEGRFVREHTRFRNWVTPDGRPGPSGHGGFAAAPGRYHLYVSLACPWAHRTLLFRKLKRLDGVIGVSAVSPLMGSEGWTFDQSTGSSGDPVNGAHRLADIYLLADPRYTGRVTVPVLWDKQSRSIVNNESSEIIRMLNGAFDAFTDDRTDYYPADLRDEIDRINAVVYSRPTRKRSPPWSRHWTSWSSACPHGAISQAPASPKRIGGCSPRWCASTPSMSAISNAICGASPTIRPSRTICASSTRCPASPRR
jgi:glutathionyl-hydroquinone reductase